MRPDAEHSARAEHQISFVIGSATPVHVVVQYLQANVGPKTPDESSTFGGLQTHTFTPQAFNQDERAPGASNSIISAAPRRVGHGP